MSLKTLREAESSWAGTKAAPSTRGYEQRPESAVRPPLLGYPCPDLPEGPRLGPQALGGFGGKPGSRKGEVRPSLPHFLPVLMLFLTKLKKKKNLYLVSRDFIQNHHCKGSRNCLTEYALARPAGISRVKANGLPFFPRSAAKSCPTLCDPTNCSTPGLPLLHHLPELARTHVHQVRDVVQPSHPLSPPSPPAPNLAQHQGLF